MKDEDLFARAMAGVKPLKEDPRGYAGEARMKRPAARAMRQAAPAGGADAPAGGHGPCDPLRRLGEGWARSGVPAARLRELARTAPERSLDLHGCTREEAFARVERFIVQAQREGVRVVEIVHGRGLHSGGRPVLKSAVLEWLTVGTLAAFVLAVAPRKGTGGGASLILIRRRR